MEGDRKAFIVGISGASSSGKTTLARLLRDVFPNTFVLHEDDFYKPETELPIKEGLLDWDCAEAISIPDLARALSHIRAHGTFPVSLLSRTRRKPRRTNSPPGFQPRLDSKEDQNSIGAVPVPRAAVAAARDRVAAWSRPGQPGHAILGPSSAGASANLDEEAKGKGAGLRICIVDGFLLYSPEMEAGGVTAQLDAKLFLVVSRVRATERRAARDGYVTLEGFWTDPPGYVEKVVWPNYVAAHARLFERGDVDRGRLDERALRDKGILAQVGGDDDVDMRTTFDWAVDMLMRQLEEFAAGAGAGAGAGDRVNEG
ncbi:ribosylnicotinamide kinase [Parahypoxylon ruwenzoriense]